MPTPPPEPPRSGRGPVLEPVRVQRLRRFDALAELMREVMPDLESVDPAAPAPTARAGGDAEDDTQELPPAAPAPAVPPAFRAPPRGSGTRRAAVVLTVAAAALVGFGCALLLPAHDRTAAAAGARPSRAAVVPTASQAPPAASTGPGRGVTGAVDPDGAGTLRQGDAGPEVVDLEQRLLRIPDVYRDGSTLGTYDSTLTEAVARFQTWYGVSGDERGVYGDDTRRALESRTDSATG
ncbi:peptidoglycan-binding protein [Streptomyces sp. NPDC090108]|uniref:peptidoglycan-binding protein n=1 Tax=Streptomyces sp. NPDC090108 TaxID=3365947 RepID=UPI0038087B5A